MNIVIVSHPSRINYVERLVNHLPITTTVIDTVSALSGHRMALRLALACKGRTIIMEDDAIPVVDFERKAQEWFDHYPHDLLSFYLGTSRPRDLQPMVDERVRIADEQGRRQLQMPTLMHGVCYSIPEHDLPKIVQRLEQRGNNIREAD